MRDRIVRAVAGTFVLLSLALGYFVNEYWFLFTAFVGLNLLQSSMTRWCLLEDILRKVGIKSQAEEVACAFESKKQEKTTA